MNRSPRLSLRARITVLFVGTVFCVGLLLIALVYAYLKFTPVPFQATFPTEQDGIVIDAAVPVTEEILRVVLGASLGALALLTVLAGALGWFVAGLVLRPLQGIAATARDVSAGNLTTRIPYDGPADEIADVTEALNTMLDSVQSAVDRQKRFAANASHELKTPIATIQTMADVALTDQDPTIMATTLARIREVNAANGQTVAALLQLATLAPETREVDLGALTAEVAAAYALPCHSEPLLIDASVHLLTQAIDNLARNAVIHGEEGKVRAYKEGPDAVIEVENAGPTIENPASLTEAFSGSRSARGHGLGLALTKEIARAHGGRLQLQAREGGGLIARMRVPLRA